jgi:spore coat protein CotH
VGINPVPAPEEEATAPRAPAVDDDVETTGSAPAEGFPFDDSVVYDIALDLPPDSVDGLVFGGDYVPATFEVDGLQVNVGVRLKGSSTFDNLDGKPSFKVSFGAFAPGKRFLGLERLTLNAMKFDPTMLREAVAYHLFGEVGIPSPRHGFATLSINGEPYGVYGTVETLDEHFLARVLPDDRDGNLYDSTFIAADLTGLGVGNFDLQEGDPATAYADLQALVGALDGGNILDVLQTRFEPDAVLDFLAMDLATANWDGYSRNTNNFLLYHATLTDRWYFVPWGQDTAFRGAGPLYGGVRARVTAACHADAACDALLQEHVHAVLATWEENDLLGWTTEQAALIGPACAADTRKREDCDFEDILGAVSERPAEVRTEIGP